MKKKTIELRWEHAMERGQADLDEDRVFGLIRDAVRHWPQCAMREQLIRDWVGTDRISRGLLVTRLGVPRVGLKPSEYASALLVAYIKSL